MSDPAPVPTPPRPPRRSGVVTPHPATRSGRVLATLIYTLTRLVDATLRYEYSGQSFLNVKVLERPLIFAIWHNRLALSLLLYRRYVRERFPERRMAALVSASRDGGMLARVLELYEVQPVRGSSSRRGAQAMRELTAWAERGYDLAITPDGPRGPRYQVQEGTVAVAQLTGLPILPVAYHLSPKVCARSWDRFQFPLPFGRCTVHLGEPMSVPRDASESVRAACLGELQKRMAAMTRD